MSKSKPHILSTVSLDSSLIDKIVDAGLSIDIMPFIQIAPLTAEALKQELSAVAKQAAIVIFTSSNAVNAVRNTLSEKPDWQIYCIGTLTKQLVAQNFGLQNIHGTADNAKELADIIIRAGGIKKVVFFCGDKRRDELPKQLAAAGIEVKEIVVYRTIATPHKLTEEYDAVLFFSPLGVESFCSENKLNEGTVLFAIGNTTAAALRQFNNKIVTSDTPAKENVVNNVIAYYSTNNEKKSHE